MATWLPRSWQCPDDPDVRIDLLRTGKYTIRCVQGDLVLGRDGRWEIEPEPSERDEYFAACYSFRQP